MTKLRNMGVGRRANKIRNRQTDRQTNKENGDKLLREGMLKIDHVVCRNLEPALCERSLWGLGNRQRTLRALLRRVIERSSLAAVVHEKLVTRIHFIWCGSMTSSYIMFFYTKVFQRLHSESDFIYFVRSPCQGVDLTKRTAMVSIASYLHAFGKHRNEMKRWAFIR